MPIWEYSLLTVWQNAGIVVKTDNAAAVVFCKVCLDYTFISEIKVTRSRENSFFIKWKTNAQYMNIIKEASLSKHKMQESICFS